MAERYDRRYGYAAAPARTVPAVDEGLRTYMLGIYNYMTGGVLLTGITAILFYRVPALFGLLYEMTPQGLGLTGLGWLVAIAPFGFVLVLSFGINRLSSGAAQMLFWAFAGVMGMSLSSIFLAYTGTSIARTFFVSATAFGALSLYGYTTKRDLSAFGKFLFMGLIGLLIAIVVNIFVASTMMDFIISAAGVLIFAGLTAWDTQRLKRLYYEVAGHGEAVAKVSVMGALSLYLDFINMFLFLLRFMGAARE